MHAQDAGNSQNKHHPLDETNLLANNSAPQNGSMPRTYAWANDPSQVVFIESDVPDLQDLLDGLAPGVEAFVLGPSSDGLQQIADILAANDLTDLSSISIVSHGGSGELELGSAIVTNANLASYAPALNEIGASLAAGGNIQLYGCDVAEGAAGQQFIDNFSSLAGGAPVEASTQLVGDAADGGSFTLNASSDGPAATGASDAVAPVPNGAASNTTVAVPFTAAALASYSGTLPITDNTGVFAIISDGTSGDGVVYGTNTGSGSGLVAGSEQTDQYSSFQATYGSPYEIQIDAQAGLFFILVPSNGEEVGQGGLGNTILEGQLSQLGSSSPTLTPIFTDDTTFGPNNDETYADKVTAFQVDVADNVIFVNDEINEFNNNTTSFPDDLEAVTFSGANFTGSTSNVTIGSMAFPIDGGNGAFFEEMAVDPTNKAAYFVETSTFTSNTTANGAASGTIGDNELFKATWTSTPTFGSSNGGTFNFSQLPIAQQGNSSSLGANNLPTSLGEIVSLAIDPTNQILYFATDAFNGGTGGLFSYDLTSNSSGNYTGFYTRNLSQVPGGIQDFVVDPLTGKYYFSAADGTIQGDNAIYEGSLGSSANPTKFITVNDSEGGLQAYGLALDNAPVVTSSGSTVTAVQDGLNVNIDSGITVTDSDSADLSTLTTPPAATVSITGNFESGDQLFINGFANGSITESGASISYAFSGSTLTLTGTATVADFQAALQKVAFGTTSGVGQSPRTITFTVDDGVLSDTATDTVDVDVLPVIGGTAGVTAKYYQSQGSTVTVLDGGITVTDGNGVDITGATVTSVFHSDMLDIPAADVSGTGISVSGDGTPTLTLSGAASATAYQTLLRDVTYDFSGDPTNTGEDKTRTITWSVTDALNLTSVAGTTTLDVYMTPVLADGPGFTTPVMTAANPPPVFADSDLALTDFNTTGTDPVATVTISSGFDTGDTLSFNNETPKTFGDDTITPSYDSATHVLTLTGTGGTNPSEFQTALQEVEFSTTANNSENGARTLTWQFNDDAGNNANDSNSLTTNIDVEFPPTIGSTGNTVDFYQSQGSTGTTLDSGITVTDGVEITGATVTITSGFLSGDTLAIPTGDLTSGKVSGTSISVSVSGDQLTLSGSDTVADYQQALRDITYDFSGDPTNTGIDKTRTITWSVTDANGQTSAAGSATTLDVYMTPVLAGTASPTPTVTSTSGAVNADADLTVTDDNTIGFVPVAIVSISNGAQTGDELSILAADLVGTGITATNNDTTALTLTGTGSTTATQFRTVLDDVQFDATSPHSGTRTLTWSFNDDAGGNPNDSNTFTTTVEAEFGPVVTAGATATYDGGSTTPVRLDSALTVTDANSSTLVSATVQITTGFDSGGDTLAVTNAGGLASSYDSGTGVLTLSGAASLATYQTALESVTYIFNPTTSDPTSGGGDTSRTISWSVNDGTTTSTAATSSLTVVHEPPTVTASGTVTFDGGSNTPVTLDSTATASVVDSAGDLTGATVAITGFVNGDTLNFTNQNSIDGTYDAATGVLTLTGTSSVTNYTTALDSITYSFSPTNGDPTSGGGSTSRTIDWSVTDGSSPNGTSAIATSTLDTVHVAPTVSAGGTVTYDGGGPGVILDSTATASDVDSAGNLIGATVSITGFVNGDTLNFTNQNSITGLYNTATGVLTLSGTSSIVNYDTALESVTYSFSPTDGDPTAGGGDNSRTISWVVNDGNTISGTSNTGSSTLDTVHVAPTVSAGGTVTFDGGGSPVTLDPTLSVSDVDSAGNLTGATVSIGSFLSGDLLNFIDQSGIAGVYDSATGVLTLSGKSSIANYDTALESITYSFSPTDGDPTNGGTDTSRTVSWTVTDGSTSNGTSNTATSTLDTVHVAPTVTAGGSTTFIGGSSGSSPLDTTLTVSDGDSGGNLTGATVSIGTGFLNGDTLNFLDQHGISGSYDSTTGVLTLSGTSSVINYQTALDSITYSFSPTNGDPTNGGSDTTRTINWSVTDGSPSNGTSNTATSTVDVVHTAPTVTAGGTVTFDGGSNTPVTLDSTATTSVVDSAGDLTGATVSIAGFINGDTLNFTNQNSIDGAYDAATGVLTLTGTSSVTNYTTALDSITYSFSPSNGDPTNAGLDTSRIIDWTVTDGSSSNGTSNAATSTLDTVHVAPVVTAGAITTFEVSGPAVAADGTLTLTDVDSGGNLVGATVSIASGLDAANDDLRFTNQNGISGSYDAATGVLTLSGTASVAGYQTALESITFSSATASTGTRTLSWSVTDGSASDGASNTGTSTVDLVLGPQITAGATATFDGGGSPVTLDGTLTVADSAQADLTGASVSISSGFLSGDTLNFTNQNGIIGSYDAVHGILTLTGTFSVANYQTALDSITYSFSPSNGDPTNSGSDATRTISWAASDSAGTSVAVTSTLDTVHVAPVVTAGGTATFGGGGPVTLDSTLTVNDIDSGGDLTGATVKISSGFIAGDTLDIGGLTSGTITDAGGTINYNFAGSTLTLSGTDTLADYQAALDSITYSFSPSGSDATSGGTDTARTVSWQVSDGSSSNGASNVATSTLSVPTTPVVTAAPSVNAKASQIFTAAQLFSASDAAGEPILTYQVEDESSGSNNGFWVLNGAVLTNGQLTTLTAAQLSELSFVAGSASTPVSDTLEVAASDAAGLGAFTTFTVTAAAHAPTAAPTVTAANELQAPNLALAGSSLFSGTAFGGNTVVSYEVEDTTTDSGHWIFNGTVEPTNQVIDVTVAQLSELSFATGYGSDTLMVRANDGTQWGNITSFTVTPPPNAAPPAGSSDTLVTLRRADGAYEFYDIGHDTILLQGPLGQINPALQVAGVGGFNGTDTADLLMRDVTTGVFTLYDVSNNNITGNVAFGQVGLEWTVSGFGDFSGHAGETDMLMRDSNTGQFEVYDIANNAITFSAPMGQVGLEWSVAGFGDFTGRANETDMLMRNNNTGAFEVYDIVNNAITSFAPMGQVGLEWQVAGFGDFSTRANETDMLMRNSNTGAFEVFDIVNNAITFAGSLGQVGLEWTIAGFGDFTGNANETDMLMRNSNTGAFELFNISNNTITPATGMGQIGLEWSISGVSATPASAPPATQLSGLAADPAGAAPSSATAQLTQAMASFAPSAGTAAASSPLVQSPPVAATPNLLAAASQNPSAMA